MDGFNIFNILTLVGGLALFIYGMGIMGQGLEKVAGARLQKIIEALTGNVMKGVLVGAVVTGAIQSSSATTVMVVGFVNAGIMNLTQAVGIIMGANIGTTVTSLMISLNVISGGNIIMQMLKPIHLAPLAIAIGVILLTTAKSQKKKEIGEVLIGFGILFTGLNRMEVSVSALRELPQFAHIFATLSNPILGILAGLTITAIIQSSSASVGILQAVAQSGVVTVSSMVPIILGQNIGTCVTALLSSVGASKNARRAAFIHLYFNVMGTMVFIVGIYTIKQFVLLPFWESTVNSFTVAKFHVIFNIANTFLLLPFNKGIVKLANATLKDSPEEKREVTRLDERFLTNPTVALSQCKKAAVDMCHLCVENFKLGCRAVMNSDISVLREMEDNERIIDKTEFAINQYLVKVNSKTLSEEEHGISDQLFHSISDFERIGDHADNLSEIAEGIDRQGIQFTGKAVLGLNAMISAVTEILDLTYKAFENNDMELAKRVEPLEEVVDMFRDTLKAQHISRLGERSCTVEAGVLYVEIIGNLERIADHCSNIAFYVIVQKSGNKKLNPHDYLKEMQNGEEFNTYFGYYKDKFYNQNV